MSFSLKNKKIWIAGHTGMVGAALMRRLQSESNSIITVSRSEVDLRNQQACARWMAMEQPEVIIIAAATVGGILANMSYPADFLYDNLMISSNILHSASQYKNNKVLFLGSSCIYPRLAEQPIAEESLLTGRLEPTNEWYALAKIAGIKLCQAYRRQKGCDFISAMPTNLYGPGDTYSLKQSHVIPALIHQFHIAKTTSQPVVTIWGTGTPYREFMYVDDLADALVYLLLHYSGDIPINVGTGVDLTIAELVEKIAKITDYQGKYEYDTSKPDGTPRKLLDVSKLKSMGWTSKINIDQGLEKTYESYLNGQGRFFEETA
jgi:GDP-L-fucose synthase